MAHIINPIIAITNYHKARGLPHICDLIVLQTRSPNACLDGLILWCQRAVLLPVGLRRIHSLLILVLTEISSLWLSDHGPHFPADCELKSIPKLLEAITFLGSWPSSFIFKARNKVLNPCHITFSQYLFWDLLSHHLPQPKRTLCF
jgi:hypothetical protein